jgi:transcription elongation factor Elf1
LLRLEHPERDFRAERCTEDPEEGARVFWRAYCRESSYRSVNCRRSREVTSTAPLRYTVHSEPEPILYMPGTKQMAYEWYCEYEVRRQRGLHTDAMSTEDVDKHIKTLRDEGKIFKTVKTLISRMPENVRREHEHYSVCPTCRMWRVVRELLEAKMNIIHIECTGCKKDTSCSKTAAYLRREQEQAASEHHLRRDRRRRAANDRRDASDGHEADDEVSDDELADEVEALDGSDEEALLDSMTLQHMLNLQASFQEHMRRVEHQRAAYNKQRSLEWLNTRSRCVITLDYSPFFSIYQRDLTSSEWFNRGKVSDLVMVVERCDATVQMVERRYLDFFGDTCADDTQCVRTCLRQVVRTLVDEGVRELAAWTDGGPRHFKLGRSIYNVTCELPIAFPGLKTSWHFFASNHGKSDCDRHARLLKSRIREESTFETFSLAGAAELAKWASSLSRQFEAHDHGHLDYSVVVDVDTLKLPMRQCHEFWSDDPKANKVRARRLSGDHDSGEFAAIVTVHRWANVCADSDDDDDADSEPVASSSSSSLSSSSSSLTSSQRRSRKRARKLAKSKK